MVVCLFVTPQGRESWGDVGLKRIEREIFGFIKGKFSTGARIDKQRRPTIAMVLI